MRYWLLFAAGVAITIAVTAVRPVGTRGPLARDFEAYWSAGVTSGGHADPYGKTIWSAERGIAGVDARRDEILPFISPPHTLVIWRLAARLRYETATYLWWSILGISLAVLVIAILVGSSERVTALSFFAAALFAVSYAPISSDLALGQIALPAFLGATLVIVFAERHVTLAAFAAVLAFAQPNVALGLASSIGRNRVTLAILAGAALTYALGSLVAGWAWPWAYAHAAGEHGLAERFAAIQSDPAAIAYAFGATPNVAAIVAAAVALIAVAAAIVLCRAVRDSFARFAGLSSLVPFVVGFFHEHDFVVAFAAALWSATKTTGAARAIALAGTLLVGFDWLGLAQRTSAIAQSALLEAALFAAFLALGERLDLRRAVPVAAGAAAVIAGAAILAVHHPVPVWPDLLAGFRAPATAGVAAVWFNEQRANGLFAAVPAWGILRALSLLGCALLAFAVGISPKYRHPSYYRTA